MNIQTRHGGWGRSGGLQYSDVMDSTLQSWSQYWFFSLVTTWVSSGFVSLLFSKCAKLSLGVNHCENVFVIWCRLYFCIVRNVPRIFFRVSKQLLKMNKWKYFGGTFVSLSHNIITVTFCVPASSTQLQYSLTSWEESSNYNAHAHICKWVASVTEKEMPSVPLRNAN